VTKSLIFLQWLPWPLVTLSFRFWARSSLALFLRQSGSFAMPFLPSKKDEGDFAVGVGDEVNGELEDASYCRTLAHSTKTVPVSRSHLTRQCTAQNQCYNETLLSKQSIDYSVVW
jgi:hypothetical protein